MPNVRVYFILAAVATCVWIYYFNLTYIIVRLRNIIITHADAEDAEMWGSLALETENVMYIQRDPQGVPLDDVQAYRSNLLIRRKHSWTDVKTRSINLDINKSEILVLMHIQKTGGTYLEDHLACHTTVLPRVTCKPMPRSPGRQMCTCVNKHGQTWMINRHCNGWICGVHPGFMELTSCLDLWFSSQVNEHRTRNYHYVTMIRDPVIRFASEWLHVRRGSTWKESRLHCDGRDASLQEVPFCFKHGFWNQVSFWDFMNCSSNMAFNRQTRMLANLSLSDCYRLHSNKTQTQREEIMLQSAKDNLAKFFAFFGITEYMKESQKLFEKTFSGLQFTKDMDKKKSRSSHIVALSQRHWDLIVEKNQLDVRLYQYAKDLFLQRLELANITVHRDKDDVVIVDEDFKYIVVKAV